MEEYLCANHAGVRGRSPAENSARQKPPGCPRCPGRDQASRSRLPPAYSHRRKAMRALENRTLHEPPRLTSELEASAGDRIGVELRRRRREGTEFQPEK